MKGKQDDEGGKHEDERGRWRGKENKLNDGGGERVILNLGKCDCEYNYDTMAQCSLCVQVVFIFLTRSSAGYNEFDFFYPHLPNISIINQDFHFIPPKARNRPTISIKFNLSNVGFVQIRICYSPVAPSHQPQTKFVH